ncbi:hypothetical protein DP116_10615 [Brasilonema bromeliae SPC951]|uniref:Uncharacterized protein n=1 Tax=Brasilonema bromeliae SPC951 TaxID=385972 RepID=A0ABX1P681_9CYAN|nr:hypothetical protein [Brasilonema bromeliae SPC951]
MIQPLVISRIFVNNILYQDILLTISEYHDKEPSCRIWNPDTCLCF